jgi:hypothetical protein
VDSAERQAEYLASADSVEPNQVPGGYGAFRHDQPTYRLAAWGPVAAALAVVAAVWIAAGSTGLLAQPLQRALSILFLVTALLAPVGSAVRSRSIRILLTPLVACAAIACLVFNAPPVSITAGVLVLVFLSLISKDQPRDVFVVTAATVAAFGVYTFARTALPWFWLAADGFGHSISAGTAFLLRKELNTGATFAGVDFLFVTTVFWIGCLAHTRPPRAVRALYGFTAIAGAQLFYLAVLAFVPDILRALNPQLAILHQALPWNLPALLGVIDLTVIAAMIRWSIWIPPFERPTRGRSASALLIRLVAGVTAVALAVLLPALTVLHQQPATLAGRKVVFYEKGFLNWLKPTHGSYGRVSVGMYGMLPDFLRSLGAECVISPDLSEADLKDAQALVLLFPKDPWAAGQLERVHNFVRAGGSLLLMGEHTEADPNGGGNRFNEVLAPTNMRIPFDSALFAVGGWLDSYEPLYHPTTIGIPQDRNQFGVVTGASVNARWPAKPILVGRWGWNDRGDPAKVTSALLGNYRYEPGERLGDTVLAAEQRLGKGRIIAFGDTSSLTNGINVNSYAFTSQLFAYLSGGADALPWERQLLCLALAIGLIVLLTRRPAGWRSVLVALGLAASLVVCMSRTAKAMEMLPDGRGQTPNSLAYIDASHLEAYSGESWRPDGIGGLALTLMRNGYLTLSLPELTAERLERAGLLISIAPSRSFSLAEQMTVEKFVRDGGVFIMMVGYDQRAGSATMLKRFGFDLGSGDGREPEPMGHFKSPYQETKDRRVYVRFHAGWPIRCDDPNVVTDLTGVVYGQGNRPVLMVRSIGKGKVALVGDTCFAMNVNLENEGGEPFEGLRENADFWRWWLSLLRGGPPWIPPALQEAAP